MSALAIPTNIRLGLNGLQGKQPRSIPWGISDEGKMFYSIGTWHRVAEKEKMDMELMFRGIRAPSIRKALSIPVTL